MAEDSMRPIYCVERSNDVGLLAELMNAKNQGTDAATMAALFSRNGYGSDNPFVYLIWMMFAQRMWGGDWQNHVNDSNYGYQALSNQIAQFQTRMADGHNTDLLFGQMNSGFDKATGALQLLQSTMCDVKAAIAKISGDIGVTGERVINSAILGNRDILAAIKDCCCQTQQNIIKMGYEQQLALKDQTYQIGERFTGIANGLQKGFADLGYIAEKNKCDIINAGNANTQRIVDVLNSHWSEDLKQRYNDVRLELSQKRQNEYLIEKLAPAT